ncbi:hypothetical protein HNP39_003026 [Bacillus aerius]|uniref:Uncharacterized protein n=1 Tax=Bacillus aerius TaxID=293388 RepID=A0ABR6B581_9BACI|nr:hypothetical protein [Bacillus aerius]
MQVLQLNHFLNEILTFIVLMFILINKRITIHIIDILNSPFPFRDYS